MFPVFPYIYIVLHECVIAFSILYILWLSRWRLFLSMPDVHVSRISPCMLFNHWSAYADWSSIPVQSASSKKRHLNYLFVMTIQLSFRLVLGTLLYHCFLLRSSDWRTNLVPMIWFGAILLRHVHSYISIKSYSSNCFLFPCELFNGWSCFFLWFYRLKWKKASPSVFSLCPECNVMIVKSWILSYF